MSMKTVKLTASQAAFLMLVADQTPARGLTIADLRVGGKLDRIQKALQFNGVQYGKLSAIQLQGADYVLVDEPRHDIEIDADALGLLRQFWEGHDFGSAIRHPAMLQLIRETDEAINVKE